MKWKMPAKKKKKEEPLPERQWFGPYGSTVGLAGQESRSGYGRPRRFWDSETALERERRLQDPDHPQEGPEEKH